MYYVMGSAGRERKAAISDTAKWRQTISTFCYWSITKLILFYGYARKSDKVTCLTNNLIFSIIFNDKTK